MKSLSLALSLVAMLVQTRPPQGPARDNTTAPAGTATLSGRVLTDDAAGQPLRRVVVTLASGGLQTPQVTVTDDAGRYRFVGVAHGSYTLSAMRAGYVPSFYGSKRAGKG